MGNILLRLSPLLLLVVGCMTTGKEKETSSAPRNDGRAIYERSCARCHALYMPKSFSADDWRFYVKKYGRRARLREGQRDLVLGYLSRNARDGNRPNEELVLAPAQTGD